MPAARSGAADRYGPSSAPSQAKPSHGNGTPMQQQHSVWASMAAKHGSECGQEHAPRPNSAVQKCRPVSEQNTRRGVWSARQRVSTWNMSETLATFHLLMSALKVGFALNRIAMLVTAAVFQSAMLPYIAAAAVGLVAHAVAAVPMFPFVMAVCAATSAGSTRSSARPTRRCDHRPVPRIGFSRRSTVATKGTKAAMMAPSRTSLRTASRMLPRTDLQTGWTRDVTHLSAANHRGCSEHSHGVL